MAAGPHAAEEHARVSEAHPCVIQSSEIARLIDALVRRGYDVHGPTARDGAIVYDRLESASDLPMGWTDEQEPGHYRLQQRQTVAENEVLFSYVVGPQSLKKYFHPSEVRLFAAERTNSTFRILNNETAPKRPFAFLGARACELEATAVQDRVLLEDKFVDPVYKARRSPAFIVAVHCTRSAKTCFCASMGTGPRARAGFDLALTELIDAAGHRFLVESGSPRGTEVLAELQSATASDTDVRAAESAIEDAARQQVRSIDTTGIKELLYQNFDHPRWDHVASRCLACANCTMVCPTCFCTTVEDTTNVTGDHAERWRRWDSCFTLGFSYIHGGNIRNSTKARYRQWMTHKLASWLDQFGRSGCVGCGRCITWCPAGIDITEEVRAIREEQTHGKS